MALHVVGRKLKVPPRKTPTVEAPPVVEQAKPVQAKPVEAPAVDLTVLDLSVSKLVSEIESGKHDSVLQALIDAEEAGKSRKGALSALRDRKGKIA